MAVRRDLVAARGLSIVEVGLQNAAINQGDALGGNAFVIERVKAALAGHGRVLKDADFLVGNHFAQGAFINGGDALLDRIGLQGMTNGFMNQRAASLGGDNDRHLP